MPHDSLQFARAACAVHRCALLLEDALLKSSSLPAQLQDCSQTVMDLARSFCGEAAEPDHSVNRLMMSLIAHVCEAGLPMDQLRMIVSPFLLSLLRSAWASQMQVGGSRSSLGKEERRCWSAAPAQAQLSQPWHLSTHALSSP